MTSSKSMACWPEEATLTIRASAEATSRARRRTEPVAQQRREQEARQVVDGEAQLVAVGALLASLGEADARVVDEHVEAVGHLVGQRAPGAQRRQVADDEPHVAGPVEQVGERLAATLLAARMGDDGGALARQACGQRPAEAVRGAGDQDRAHGGSRLPRPYHDGSQ